MPRERDLKLDKYGIDKNRYLELKYFCRQYPKWKQQLADLHCGYKPIALTGLPGGSGTSDTVGKAATKAAELSKQCELIEQCCIEADDLNYQVLLKCVTGGVSWDRLNIKNQLHELSWIGNEKSFYLARRKFFYLLSERRK